MTPPSDPLLWLVDAGAVDEASLAYHAGWLGASERERCARFVRAERRRQFVVGRALLRRALGSLLALDPATIALEERPGQAPELVFPRAVACGFSISHSGPWVACAASTHTLLGIDIERVDPARDVLALAEQAFGPDEVAFLRTCEPGARHHHFYRMWSRHEACFKLGMDSEGEYVLEAPGLSGMLACAHRLSAVPRLDRVWLDEC